jgi:hypothetical protein
LLQTARLMMSCDSGQRSEGSRVDALTNLYERLRAQAPAGTGVEPPSYEQWLQYWNDEETEIANLRNFQHWLSRALDTSTL